MIDNLLPYVKNVNYKYIAAKRRKSMKLRNKGIVKAMTMFAALIIMVTGLYGCGTGAAGTSDEDKKAASEGYDITAGASVDNPYTFTDDYGRSFTVTSHNRVAAMIGSFADIWTSAGGEIVAAANDTWTNFDLGLSESVVNIGGILNPNTELLIAAQPDFVIASCNTDSNIALMSTLENAGITVAYFDVSNFSQYLNMLDHCTMITGRRDLYKTNGEDVKAQIDEVKRSMGDNHPKVLFIRAAASSVKAKGSTGSVGGEMLADLGCINIADSDKSLLDDLSLEAIVAADPDYIFVTTQGNDTEAAMKNFDKLVSDNPAWSSLRAVKESRYYVLDKKLYNLKPNAQWGKAYKQLAEILNYGLTD